MLDTMKTNWKQICDQLNTDPELASAAGEKKVLMKVENIYHIGKLPHLLSLQRYVSHITIISTAS